MRHREKTVYGGMNSWTKIVGMRHMLVHEYFAIDLDIVWQVVIAELPKLKQQIEKILKDANHDS